MEKQQHSGDLTLMQQGMLGSTSETISENMVSDNHPQTLVNDMLMGNKQEVTPIRLHFVPQPLIQKQADIAAEQVHSTQHFITLDCDVFERWRCVGTAHGLASDTEIATYLIKQAEEAKSAQQAHACCATCRGVLLQYCSKCSLWDASSISSLHPSEHSLKNGRTFSVSKELTVEAKSLMLGCSDDPSLPMSQPVHRQVSRADKPPVVTSSVTLSTDKTPYVTLPSLKTKLTQNAEETCVLCELDYWQTKTHLKKERILKSSVKRITKKNHKKDGKRTFTRKKTVPEKRPHVETDEETPANMDLSVSCLLKKSSVDGIREAGCRKTWSCNECSAAFSNSTNLKDHLRTHTGERPFRCEHCPATFRCAGNLKSHNRKHTGERPFKCDICDKAFARNTTLTTHMRIHTNDRPYKCDLCDAAFRQQGLLVIHKRKHSGEKPFSCKLCAAAFFSSGSLSAHMASHVGLKPFLCDECGSAFTQKGILKAHMLTHTGERSFSCEQCGKAFHRKNGLQAHQRIHSDIKNFRCAICAAAFHTPSNFRRHMHKHSGYKPHVCTKCSKHFASTSELKVHTRIHTGDKPYICRDCGKGFITAGNMNKHWNNQHKPKPPYHLSLSQA